MNTLSSNSNVNLHLCGTVEKAAQDAQSAAANVAGIVVPVIIFKQGNRILLTGALPIGFARQRLHRVSAAKKASITDARAAMNRPLDNEHAKTIAKYLVDNQGGKFLIPPLTLNVQQVINVYTIDIDSTMRLGYIVIPMTAILSITDGQHREVGIEQAYDLLPDDQKDAFDKNSIAVMIVCESEVDQIHQDFADASKTKALPASQLAVYDRRNPANGLVLDLIEACPLLKDKVDATSSSLGKGSLAMFLTNQVRQMVKELLVGSYAMPDDSFEEKAKRLLGARGEPQYNETLDRFVAYIDAVTEAIPTLRQIAKLNTAVEMSQIPVLRKEGWICLTATGMNVIGRIGHILFRDGHENWADYAAKLGDVKWERDAAIWQGNVIQNSKIMTQQAPVRNAVEAVAKVIELPLTSGGGTAGDESGGDESGALTTDNTEPAPAAA
jgi:DNA sulfur modification protein DndB